MNNTTGQTVSQSNDTTYFLGTAIGNQFNNEEVNITGVQAFITEMTIVYSNAESGANSRQVISISPIIFCESRDSDNDGVPDHIDLDADNDGIYDVFEAGLNPNDSDNNGKINSQKDAGFADANNNNRMDDVAETNTPTDTDSDGNYDYLELDSDNDGCYDVVEAGFTDGDTDGYLGNSLQALLWMELLLVVQMVMTLQIQIHHFSSIIQTLLLLPTQQFVKV